MVVVYAGHCKIRLRETHVQFTLPQGHEKELREGVDGRHNGGVGVSKRLVVSAAPHAKANLRQGPPRNTD